ncbi:MAG TPA: hypothetical protein VEL28_18395 [Candidatus Binatia bacterium]|nr:hypothetical protein [Candidatus Binatia bacterium]
MKSAWLAGRSSPVAAAGAPASFFLVCALATASAAFPSSDRSATPSHPDTAPSLAVGPASTRIPADAGPAPFAAYAGSGSCRQCHASIFDAWRASNHALAERAPATLQDQAAFEPPRSFGKGPEQTHVRGSDGQYAIATGDAPSAWMTVERVIGHDPLRQFLLALAAGFRSAKQPFIPAAVSGFSSTATSTAAPANGATGRAAE